MTCIPLYFSFRTLATGRSLTGLFAHARLCTTGPVNRRVGSVSYSGCSVSPVARGRHMPTANSETKYPIASGAAHVSLRSGIRSISCSTWLRRQLVHTYLR